MLRHIHTHIHLYLNICIYTVNFMYIIIILLLSPWVCDRSVQHRHTFTSDSSRYVMYRLTWCSIYYHHTVDATLACGVNVCGCNYDKCFTRHKGSASSAELLLFKWMYIHVYVYILTLFLNDHSWYVYTHIRVLYVHVYVRLLEVVAIGRAEYKWPWH